MVPSPADCVLLDPLSVERHGGSVVADVGDVQSGRCTVPPAAVWISVIAEPRVTATMKQIIRVTEWLVGFETFEIKFSIGLLERAFVM